ncbi:MAG TPA: hypothetical protein VGS41_18940, partial [Chthonomonadales bacterium]|nr:hypothetical protein [Chthonomonadales bacterium]
RMDKEDRRVANGQGGYNCGVYVNSQNPDIVYIINTSSYRSLDGGKTFTGFKGAPGGDDPQQMWIDPTDGNRLLLGTDQGATISLDGGQNWSSWYNQPTAQVYHISVDNRWPYWVYATQQDSDCIGTASRGNFGEITPLDWLPHPGYEFGSIVADPLNPLITYAGGEAGGIIKTTYPSGQWINVSPNQEPALKLRKTLNQPLLYSPRNPHELLAGFQYAMATTDGGARWHKLSPDLTVGPGAKPAAGPAVKKAARPAPRKKSASPAKPAKTSASSSRNAPAGGEPDLQRFAFGAAIESLSVSPVDGNVIWAGTTNGIIQVTRDHGAIWQNVSIAGPPDAARADVSGIDTSHQDAATAYAAVDLHNTGDNKPYFYRTHDYGRTWALIVNGLPQHLVSGAFARVIRADTVRPGLLFAGTESGVYVSFNDGDQWQSLQRNLPNTSIRDMAVKDDDLVVGTFGRSFWVLDDISPLREMKPDIEADEAYLFAPSLATRVRRNVNGDTPFPPEVPHAENPPLGAVIYYYLGGRPAGDITLVVKDSRGELVRRMSSAPIPASTDEPPPVPDFWVQKPVPLPTASGLNRVNWELRYDSPPAFSHTYEINANPGETPPSPQGPLALPGRYTITLTVDGKSYSRPVEIRNDPRSPASYTDLRKQHDLQMKVYQCSIDAWNAFHQVAAARSSIQGLLKSKPPAAVAAAAHGLDTKLAAVGGQSGGFGRFGPGFFRPGGPAPRETFSSLSSAAVRQIKLLDSGDMAPTEAMRHDCDSLCAQLKAIMKDWSTLEAGDLKQFNALLAKNNLKPIGGAATVSG